MSKFFMLVLCMNFLSFLLPGQSTFQLSGKVVDENNQPLPGASVFLSPPPTGTVTDRQGNFSFSRLAGGKYTLSVSFIGYKTYSDTLTLSDDDWYRARLIPASVNLQEVVVSDNYIENRKKEEPLNMEIVNDEYLKQNLGGSLMESLERLPGISTIEIGSGQTKPVIRGLSFNRVVVVENSIKHEGQQWGDDHGLEIDQYATEQIEIIKGPASLMYGSDAIGGVIDLNNRELPVDHSIGGTVDLTGKTNNDLLGFSLMFSGRKNWFFAAARATLTDYGDYKVPADSVDIYSYRAPLYHHHLRNTAGNEINLHLSAGIVKSRFISRFYISNVKMKSGFFANAHGLEPRNVDETLHDQSSRDINLPFQEVNHFKIINTTRWVGKKSTLEVDLGFQRNFRQEWSQYVNHGYMPPVYPDSLGNNPDLEREFEKYIYSANIKYTYNLTEKLQCVGGINGDYMDNRIGGRSFIIPAFHQLNTGLFAFARYAFSEKSILQAGVRFDFGHINTQEYFDWFPSPVIEGNDTTYQYLKRSDHIDRQFTNITWSVGYNFNSSRWSVKANIGKSFRMPIAKELASNGVNYHHFSYEIGNPGLSPEIAYQFDAGAEYQSKRVAIGVTPFVSYFPNYIYLNPSPEYDRLYGNGNQIYYYTQSRVIRFGGEIHAHYQLLKSLQIGVMGEYIYSEQLSGAKKGFTLPFSPPASAIFSVKYQKQFLKPAEQVYISIDYRITAKQNNIVPPEEPTPGSQAINIGMGAGFRIAHKMVNFSFQIQNLLNTNYFNHTSYYRLINVPEPGRNFILNISIPFTFNTDKNLKSK